MQQVKANIFPKQKNIQQTKQKQRKTGPKKGLNKSKKTKISLQYRPRTSEDDSYIVQLTKEQLGEIHAKAFGEPFPEQEFMRYIQSGAPTFLIEDGERKIGYFSYLMSPDQKMHITALVIESGFQSAGIGKSIMEQLERVALANSVLVMEVFVQENNQRSIEFTKSLGFSEIYKFHPNTICFRKQIRQGT